MEGRTTTNLLLGRQETLQAADEDFIILLQKPQNGYCYQFWTRLDPEFEIFSVDLRLLGELNYRKYEYKKLDCETFYQAMDFFYGFLRQAICISLNESGNILNRMMERSLRNDGIKKRLKEYIFSRNSTAETNHEDFKNTLRWLYNSRNRRQDGGSHRMFEEISTLHDVLCLALHEMIVKYDRFSNMIVTVVGNPINIEIKGVTDFQLTTEMLEDASNAVRERAILQSRHWEFLGKGAFGTCVRHKEENTIVLKSLSYSTDDSESWKREASYAHDLEHVNVVKVLSKPMIYNHHIFFLTEYAGMSLGDIYRGKEVTMDVVDIRRALLDISRAARYIHSERLIHRDIHADNVTMGTVNGNKIFKLIDFGMSTVVPEGQSRAPSITETRFNPLFASPERCLQLLRAVSSRAITDLSLPIPGYKSDVWMIGIFGLQLLCFSARKNNPAHFDFSPDRLEEYKNHLICNRIRFEELTDEAYDEGVRGILEHCLKYNEEERWDSHNLYTEIEQLVNSQNGE